MRGKQHGQPAFTLVELLVVIGIIAMLLAILLPALTKARQQANCLACQANLKSIGQAIQIYVVDSRGILPYGYWDGTFNPQQPGLSGMIDGNGADWTDLLQGSIASSMGSNFTSITPNLTAKIRAVFLDPDAPQDQTTTPLNWLTIIQYTCHPRLMPQLATVDGAKGPRAFLSPYKLAHVKRSSEIALVFDAVVAPVTGGGWSVPYFQPVAQTLDNWQINGPDYLLDYLNPNGPIDLTVSGTTSVNMDVVADGQNVRFRHLGNRVCNALMADLHVESFHMQTATTCDLMRNNLYVNP